MLKCLPFNYVELVNAYMDYQNTNTTNKLNPRNRIMYEGGYYTVDCYPKEDIVRLIDEDSRSVYTLTQHDTPLEIADMTELRGLLEYIERELPISISRWVEILLDGQNMYIGKLMNIYKNNDAVLIKAVNGNTYRLAGDEIEAYRDCVTHWVNLGDKLQVHYEAETIIDDIDELTGIDGSIAGYLEALFNVENLSTHLAVTYPLALPAIKLELLSQYRTVSSYGYTLVLHSDAKELHVSDQANDTAVCNYEPLNSGKLNMLVKLTSKRKNPHWCEHTLMSHFIELINNIQVVK